MKDTSTYLSAIEKARELTKDLEEPLKTSAFEVILSDIIRRESDRNSINSKGKEQLTPESTNQNDQMMVFLASAVDPGEYATILTTRGHLREKSMIILKIAKDSFGIEGLDAPQIYKMLTQKFQIKEVHRQNINRELLKVPRFVTRIRNGKAQKYILLEAGREHLKQMIEAESKTQR